MMFKRDRPVKNNCDICRTPYIILYTSILKDTYNYDSTIYL